MIGIDLIIQNLRPGAKFTLNNNEFIEWEHGLPPPTWDEIEEYMNNDLN